MAKKTATFAELASAISAESATADANRQHQAARECIAIMRELRPDGMPGDNFQEKREFQSAWLSSEIPGLTIDRAKKLQPLELLAMLRLLKERLNTPKGTVAVESAIPTPAATDGTDQPPGYLGLTIDANRRTVSRSGYPAVVDGITQKEWSLFVAMLRAAERGLTKEESERAYDGEKDSIRDTKSRLRGKLLPLDVTVAKGKSKLIASVRGSSEISDEA